MTRIKYVSVGSYFVNFELMIYRMSNWNADGQLLIMNSNFFAREGTIAKNGDIVFKNPETWVKMSENDQQLLKEAHGEYMDEVAEEILLRKQND